MTDFRLHPNALLRRTIEVLPILLAMLFHAIAMERWLLIVPAAIAVAYRLNRSATAPLLERASIRQWYLVVIGGLLLGLVIPAADISNAVLPPVGAAALTGLSVVICVYAVFTGQLTVGWVSAWALVAMSGKREMGAGLLITLLGFLIGSLVAALLHAGMLKHRLREFAIWLGLVTAIATSTLFMSFLITGIDNFFVNSFQRLRFNQPKAASTGLSDRVTLGTKSTINPSRQPLLELSQLPGLLRVNAMDEFHDNQWTTSSKLKNQLGQLDESLQAGEDARSIEMLFLDDLDQSIPSPAGTSRIQNASTHVEGGWIIRGKPDGVAITIIANVDQKLPPESIDDADLLAVPDDLQSPLSQLASRCTGATAMVTQIGAKQNRSLHSFRQTFSTL